MQSNVLTAAPSSEVPSQSQVDITMDVDPLPPHERGIKRSAEDDPAPEGHKKVKIGTKFFCYPCYCTKYLTMLPEQKNPPLKRFVSSFNSTRIME